MLRASHALSATMLALLAAVAAPAHAVVTITGVATNLADTTPGQDLWRLDFNIAGAMASGEFVNFALSSGLFSNVAQIGATPAGYNANLALPAFFGDSYHYTITDAGSASVSTPVALSVVRIGALPGTIAYATNTNASGFGNVALTSAPVPEPATYGLMALGLAAMGLRRRAQKA
ncbi:PEP-CTERM putative exosortase interaction domain-containing protein [Burkholderiales bacterium JOSHI_001]|nr:PEP-CTERM putative exosortase interaction domain-containing protein [Burkholderiales bacterium JOSHI_001]